MKTDMIILNRYSLIYKYGFRIELPSGREWYSEELWYRDQIQIYSHEKRELAIIKWSSIWNLLRIKKRYTITYKEQRFRFKQANMINHKWELSSPKIGLYRVIEHGDLNFSIFKNDVQVARAEKNSDSYFTGDRYEIISNQDEDELLLAAIFILIGKSKYDLRENLIHLGNFWHKTHEDKHWKPK